MYKIIGGDQKEYGPISAEQIRQWFKEGRLNGQSSVLPEGGAQWTPLSMLPEFADLFAPASAAFMPPLPGAPPLPVASETILNRDYTLDIGDCISRSWTLVKDNFWPVVGISFLVMIIVGGVNQVLGLISAPATNDMINNRHFSVPNTLLVMLVSLLSGPVDAVFTGGLFRYYLKLIRGEEASIGDAFSGFNFLGQLVLLGLVRTLLIWVGILFCVLPGIYLSIAWIFALPLLVDRDMKFWDAMELSRQVVTKHWFLVFAFVLVVGLVMICGIVACCIGIIVTMTIGWVAVMYAYEDIFSRQTS